MGLYASLMLIAYVWQFFSSASAAAKPKKIRASDIRKLSAICDETLTNNQQGIVPFQSRPAGGIFLEAYLPLFAGIFKRLKLGRGKKFLDVGSGDGRIVLLVAMFGAEAAGVELDPGKVQAQD